MNITLLVVYERIFAPSFCWEYPDTFAYASSHKIDSKCKFCDALLVAIITYSDREISCCEEHYRLEKLRLAMGGFEFYSMSISIS